MIYKGKNNVFKVTSEKKGRRLYWWGLLGFIPNVGVIAGIVLFIKGIGKYKDKTLVMIGIADILFTVLFWACFNYGMEKEGWFSDPEALLAQAELNTVAKSIEFYKLQHGNYPDSLKQISNPTGGVIIYDPLLTTVSDGEPAIFHYKKIRDKYTLFSVGKDKIPDTKDDVYPTITNGDTVKFGFVKK